MPRRHSPLIGDSTASNAEVWRAERRDKMAVLTAPLLFQLGHTVETAEAMPVADRCRAIRNAWPETYGTFYDSGVWAKVCAVLAAYWRAEADKSDPFGGL